MTMNGLPSEARTSAGKFGPPSLKLWRATIFRSDRKASPSEGWSERQDFHLRPRGPKPRALKTELRSEKIGAPDGTCTHTLPADNGLLFYSATRAKWLARPKP